MTRGAAAASGKRTTREKRESMSAFRNVELFAEDRFTTITEIPEWTAERVDTTRHFLEELHEKRSQHIEEGLDLLRTEYFWISYVLRGLGFCYSVAEMTPGGHESEDIRPDFTLFYNAEEFRDALPNRATREFFHSALAVVRAYGWNDSLDPYETEEGTVSPAYEIDRLLRLTGSTWGVLTNGRKWRLFHRDSSGLMNTFYECDLIEALESNDLDAYRYFFSVFSPEGLGGGGGREPVVDRLLN